MLGLAELEWELSWNWVEAWRFPKSQNVLEQIPAAVNTGQDSASVSEASSNPPNFKLSLNKLTHTHTHCVIFIRVVFDNMYRKQQFYCGANITKMIECGCVCVSLCTVTLVLF